MTNSSNIRVLVVGAGHMGISHARAYKKLAGFEICGVVTRTLASSQSMVDELGPFAQFTDFDEAISVSKPDAVAICSYTETHHPFTLAALEAGCHVFVEKPLAENIDKAKEIAQKAKVAGRKVLVGYILRHHPSWIRFIEIAQGLGKPLVMRMNLNQQSKGDNWETHKSLINSTSPIVDCGVHYIDVMCQMTRSKPSRVHGISARLSDQIAEDSSNYGALHIQFEDGSCGWYEAGWGPMMSETAFFVKDVVGPLGSASIVAAEAGSRGKSSDVDAHCQTERILLHRSEKNENGDLVANDEFIDLDDEPDHDELCRREQLFFLDGITGKADLTEHQNSAIRASEIVLAADHSFRTGQMIQL